jgi:hypothetical protein
LLSICGAPVAGPAIKQAEHTCRTFGSLFAQRRSKAGNFRQLGTRFVTLKKLQPGHPLQEALAALIFSAMNDELGDTSVFVSFEQPPPRAVVRVSAQMLFYATPSDLGDEDHEYCDLRQSRRITEKSIHAIAASFRVSSNLR